MKSIYTLIFCVLTTAAFSQQQAGDLSIQFSGNYTSNSISFGNTSIKTRQGNIYLKLGKFFTPNIELGLKPNVLFSPDIKPDPKNSEKTITTLKTSLGLGIYGTYSFLTADAKFMPYGGAEVNYLPVSGGDATVNVGPYAGVKYFVTEKINIDANVNYLINLASTYGNETVGLDISPLFQVNIGVGVIIGKLNP
jgi:outer membrane protein W